MKICTAYDLAGKRLAEMPLDLDDLAALQPIYEDHPGWSDAAAPAPGKQLSDAALPAAARAFIDRIAELAGIPVWVASVGANRAETVVRHNPFTAAKRELSP